MEESWFWSGWQGPVRVAIAGAAAYVFLIASLRVSGKRSLSKMNAFDFIITVASGSTFAAVLLNSSVALADGMTAFSLLIAMQYGVAWLSVRSDSVQSLVKSVPTILVHRGHILSDVCQRERVARAEILAACRRAGLSSLEDVFAVVLETDGTFSVLRSAPPPDAVSTLEPCSEAPSSFE